MKRLFFDIETSFNVIGAFQTGYNQTIQHHQILEERKIICICYKWEGKEKVYSLDWDNKKQCDKRMLQEFIKIANQADQLVAHNGDRYDLPWIRTRCLFHRIDMFPEYTSVDTLKLSRSKFKFNSNKLDYISKYLGFNGKRKHEGWDMWVKVWKAEKGALKDMVDYCKDDVVELEKVFLEINNYVNQKTHKGVLEGEERWSCPRCGGSDGIYISRERVTASGIKRYQYEHKKKHGGCGHGWTLSKSEHIAKLKHDFELKQQKLK